MVSEDFLDLPPGQELPLLLIEYTPSGVGVIFPLQYIHRELAYRTPPRKKDAVAFGAAKLIGCGDHQEVRILFSRPHRTATLRGLTLEGQVKIGRQEFNPKPTHGSDSLT